MKTLLLGMILILINLPAFAVEPPQGNLKGSIFTYKPLGWIFKLPKGWEVRDSAEIARVRGIGQKAFKETLNQDIPLIPTPVLYLSHGKGNRFTSDAILYKEPVNQYEKGLDEANQQMQMLYSSKGIKTSFTKSKQNINGKSFLVYTTNILHPKNGNILARSIMLSALINKIDFTMSYLCTDKNECINIRKSVLNSKFSTK